MKEEMLQVQWTNSPKDVIHYKRFTRMGALLEWLDDNPEMQTHMLLIKIHKVGKP